MAGCKHNAVGWVGLIAALVAVPGAWADDGKALAYINGVPIEREEVVDLLMEAHGLSVLQQIIVLKLAKQETHRAGIKVTSADVREEFERALNRIAPDHELGENALDDRDKRQTLEMILDQKGLSLAEFMVGMERNAHLRKIVERDFHVDEPTLREEFARTFGERVEIRHIEVRNGPMAQARINDVQTRLQRGDDFATVARELSENTETAPSGGLWRPFTFGDRDIPAIIRERSFALSAGEYTGPIKVESAFQFIQLQRRMAPENARFEDRRAEVEIRLRDRVIPELMSELATELFQKAKIQILDRRLKDAYQAMLERNAEAERVTSP